MKKRGRHVEISAGDSIRYEDNSDEQEGWLFPVVTHCRAREDVDCNGVMDWPIHGGNRNEDSSRMWHQAVRLHSTGLFLRRLMRTRTVRLLGFAWLCEQTDGDFRSRMFAKGVLFVFDLWLSSHLYVQMNCLLDHTDVSASPRIWR